MVRKTSKSGQSGQFAKFCTELKHSRLVTIVSMKNEGIQEMQHSGININAKTAKKQKYI